MERARISRRVLAKVIDLVLAFLVASILPNFIGPFLGFIYTLVADGLDFGTLSGQSLGKKVMDLQVRSTRTNRPCTYRESVIRNSPVGFVTFFSVIPFWGWLIAGFVGIPLLAIELYLMLKAESAHRLGDVMADTEVVVHIDQSVKNEAPTPSDD